MIKLELQNLIALITCIVLGSCSTLLRQQTPVTHSGAPFSFVWEIPADDTEITLPLRPGYQYNFIVDWGDSLKNQVTAYDDADKTHKYLNKGNYTVTIIGTLEAWKFGPDRKCTILSVIDLGNVGWKNLEGAFWGCSQLRKFYGGNVSQVTNMNSMFRGASMLLPNVASWDVSQVTHMGHMFHDADVANPEVATWNVSKVTNMSYMFYGADSADPEVKMWNVSQVTNMNSMFAYAKLANPEVEGWDVSRVTDMGHMFAYADAATPNVRKWDVSKVKNMEAMFRGADLANPNVNQWDISQVNNMNSMFRGADKAVPNVSQWNVSSARDIRYMFRGADLARPDISKWNLKECYQLAQEATNCNPLQ